MCWPAYQSTSRAGYITLRSGTWFFPLSLGPDWSHSQASRLQNRKMYTWRELFSCDHDIITRVFRTDRQCTAHCSTNCAFNTQCVWYSPPDNQRCVASRSLPLLFFLFWVFGYAHAQLRSLYPLSTLDDFLEHGSLGTSLKPHFFAINFRDPIWTRM